MQNHEHRVRQQQEMEDRARETQEMALKVQEFRQEQALSERRRKQEQLDLFNYNRFGQDERRRREETQRKQKEVEEKEMIQQAVIGIVNEEREIFKKKQAIREAARHNFEEAACRRRNLVTIREEQLGRRTDGRVQEIPRNDLTSYQSNLCKFYGIDPVESTRMAKNQVKTKSHDPINGVTNSYVANKPPLRGLGAEQPEYFPGKINDATASPEVYRLPEYRKKAPRYTSYNPLIHQAINFRKLDENKDRVGLASPMYARTPVQMLDKPIYRGMGYKKSSIFD